MKIIKLTINLNGVCSIEINKIKYKKVSFIKKLAPTFINIIFVLIVKLLLYKN